MRALAQHFHGLNVCPEQRMIRARDIHEHRAPARLQHATYFLERRRNVAPMMRATATQYAVEGSIGEKQTFRL